MLANRNWLVTVMFSLSTGAATLHGAEPETPHKFERQQLSDVYFSEGVGVGDLNGDDKPDVVYGPYWFAGPDFTARHEIYPPQPQNREA